MRLAWLHTHSLWRFGKDSIMWTWLIDNAAVVSALSSLAMLGVWLIYLQLFYSSYRHRQRPKILITRGGGHTIKSRCILTNMSPEIVFIEAVILKLKLSDREVLCSLSDIDRVGRKGMDQRSELFQGPLSSGEYLDLGTFKDLIVAAMQDGDAEAAIESLEELVVTAVGSYTWHDQLAAAERCFTVRTEGARKLLDPDQITARQIRSHREKQKITHILTEQSSQLARSRSGKSEVRG
ncbi:hypothetical protein GV67_05995 [Pseudorhizobium pelagicum]|jgi:hypothetical protein|uniref:Uncharacterized protein n=2 Tax=Pseudorhizobium pelagicum TaxID=1509405 RepID=A0A922P0M0_9HYPH|nr:hypothetical protein GV67_05995 [Pseudorhizobium pelagicum]KEQ07860.1 hypothetical protein GV68_03455 [Pseudorhizobium pelagicum]